MLTAITCNPLQINTIKSGEDRLGSPSIRFSGMSQTIWNSDFLGKVSLPL
jgi:hypothetical protein